MSLGWIPFYKSKAVAIAEVAPSVAKEQARLTALERLFKMKFITAEEYKNALIDLKKAREPFAPKAPQSANALDIIQLALLAGIVGAVVYGVKQFK